jgi:AcrR family transcriptional regulator
LRGRKRRQTRTAIAKSAMQLLAQHGFDQVSVAQIAAAAGVAEKTVYNYFPAKADMFFDEASDILALSRRSACSGGRSGLLRRGRAPRPGHPPAQARRDSLSRC